ncbi:hypothetical protein [Nocardiopsis lambiniae]|uniref:Uncharacterized protein n=1 Tax=Nocardiopsis lambiniae TaxID=3075539 RepID=A0ABU2M2L6_9ACTN|nr:hypothetical protein [Nocardiopsis sp. DSM 44743]MDT0326832.1 hypothetical protein [Nocardiopsis sp. DSM 44743]
MGEAEAGTVSARGLRTPWERRSRETGWASPEDWWTPAVDLVCTTFVTGGDLAGACARLGEARARSGIGIGRAITDLAAFTEVASRGEPPLELVRALAEGWAEAGRDRRTYLDPLTGLGTPEYLRTRLGELYRHTDEVSHWLVVVMLDPGLDPWRRAARMIVLGYELSRFFTRGESVCLLGKGRIGVLTPDTPSLESDLDRLRTGPGGEQGAAVWGTPLPKGHREALTLIDRLGERQ